MNANKKYNSALIAQQQRSPVSATKLLERQRAQKKKEAVTKTAVGTLQQPVSNDVDNHANIDDPKISIASSNLLANTKTNYIRSTAASTPPVKPKPYSVDGIGSRPIRGWNDQYRILVDFYNLNGNSSVLRSDTNKALSGWVKRQRNNRKDGKLTQYQIDLLDELRFVWHRTNNAWNIKYNMLIDYYRKYGGGSSVSCTFNRQLAEWVQRQKREYRNNLNSPNRKQGSMGQARIDALERLPGWTW